MVLAREFRPELLPCLPSGPRTSSASRCQPDCPRASEIQRNGSGGNGDTTPPHPRHRSPTEAQAKPEPAQQDRTMSGFAYTHIARSSADVLKRSNTAHRQRRAADSLSSIHQTDPARPSRRDADHSPQPQPEAASRHLRKTDPGTELDSPVLSQSVDYRLARSASTPVSTPTAHNAQ